MTPRKLTPTQEIALAADYAANMRPNKLGLKYGIGTETARDYVNRLGLPKLPQRRKRQINETFFDTLTEESLWVLGWFYSDGNVSSKSNHFSVSVHSQDIEVLRLISRSLGFDSEAIYHSKRSQMCELYGCNAKTHNRLIELGCVPNKSLVIRYPTFLTEDWQHWAFLRGVLEGDGHIGFKAKANRPGFSCELASGSFLFLEDIQRLLKTKLDIDTRIKSRPNSNSRKILVEGGREAVMKLLDLLYRDGKTTLHLTRKREVYLAMRKQMTQPPDNASINRNRHSEGYFLSPAGVVYHVIGLRPFAREIGIPHETFHNMLKPRKNRFTSRKYHWTKPTADQITAARAAGTLVEKTY